MYRRLLHLALCCLIPLLASCGSLMLEDGAGKSVEATAASYAKSRQTQGVVLLDVKWGRYWSCGKFENAQLRTIDFDRFPLTKTSNKAPADLVLIQPPSLTLDPSFQSYALLIEPGKYALSGVLIKVARSVSDIAYWVFNRNELIKDGQALGGTFTVEPGETVYIGNFYLDCWQNPTLWRYYTEGKNFKGHLAQYKSKYPFLDIDNVTYRLFETTTIGRPYELK